MKFESENKESKIRSEGKLLEITPIITRDGSELFMLPPITYKVPNWLLGYDEWHNIGWPTTLNSNERMAIPGSSRANYSDLRFIIRLLEDSPGMIPESTPTVIPTELGKLIIRRLTPKEPTC